MGDLLSCAYPLFIDPSLHASKSQYVRYSAWVSQHTYYVRSVLFESVDSFFYETVIE